MRTAAARPAAQPSIAVSRRRAPRRRHGERGVAAMSAVASRRRAPWWEAPRRARRDGAGWVGTAAARTAAQPSIAASRRRASRRCRGEWGVATVSVVASRRRVSRQEARGFEYGSYNMPVVPKTFGVLGISGISGIWYAWFTGRAGPRLYFFKTKRRSGVLGVLGSPGAFGIFGIRGILGTLSIIGVLGNLLGIWGCSWYFCSVFLEILVATSGASRR